MIIEKDLVFLRQTGCSEQVIEHSVAVAEKALEISDSVTVQINRDLVKRGALHHDIGRARTQGLEHFIIGAEIAVEMGFEQAIVRIIERHIGSGISKDEAAEYGLPARDYMPETPEEIIVSYADNLTQQVTVVSFEDALERFRDRLGNEHPAIGRFVDMHNKVLSWMTDRHSSPAELNR